MVRSPFCHEHPDLFSESTLRTGLFLVEIGGTARRDVAGDFRQRTTFYFTTNNRYVIGDVLPGNRALDA